MNIIFIWFVALKERFGTDPAIHFASSCYRKTMQNKRHHFICKYKLSYNFIQAFSFEFYFPPSLFNGFILAFMFFSVQIQLEWHFRRGTTGKKRHKDEWVVCKMRLKLCIAFKCICKRDRDSSMMYRRFLLVFLRKRVHGFK